MREAHWQGVDLYFDRVTSLLSVVKTSVYLAELQRPSCLIYSSYVHRRPAVLFSRVVVTRVTHQLYLCYRLEYECPHHRLSTPPYLADIGMPLLSSPYICLTPSFQELGSQQCVVYTLTLVRTNTVFNKGQERITNAFFSCTLATLTRSHARLVALNAISTGASSTFTDAGQL